MRTCHISVVLPLSRALGDNLEMAVVVDEIPLARDAQGAYLRAQDISEIAGRDDETLLAWATTNMRVVLTHDLARMVPALLLQHQHASGCTPVVLVPDSLPIGQVIEEVLLLDRCWQESDWAVGVVYLPLH